MALLGGWAGCEQAPVPGTLEVRQLVELLRAGGHCTDGVASAPSRARSRHPPGARHAPARLVSPALPSLAHGFRAPPRMAQPDGEQARDALALAPAWLECAGQLKAGDYHAKDLAINSFDVLQLMAARGRKGSLEDKRVFGAYAKAIKVLSDLCDALKVAGHWSPDTLRQHWLRWPLWQMTR